MSLSEQLDEVKQLSAQRVPVEQISEITGVSKATIYRWRRQRYRPAQPKPRRRINGRPRLTGREAERIIDTIRTQTPRTARYAGDRPACLDRGAWNVAAIRAVMLDRYPQAAESHYTDRVLGRWLHSHGLRGNWKGSYR